MLKCRPLHTGLRARGFEEVPTYAQCRTAARKDLILRQTSNRSAAAVSEKVVEVEL